MSEKIAIAEFRAKNIKENHLTTVYVEYDNGHYYYLTFWGVRSTRYRNLDEAKKDIKDLYEKWHDFKLLV